MKAIVLVLTTVMGLAATAEARTYNCVGKEVTEGKMILKLDGENAVIKGSFKWTDRSTEDTSKTFAINAKGAMSNQGRSGNKTHDYFDLTGKTEGISYIRTGKNMESKDGGWINLVIPGPADHDMPGYAYAAFFCREKE